MTSIDPSLYLKSQQKQGAGTSPLGKDDFLKILMAQIQNQNPLNPMEDKEFISQMTEFSSLEQMTNMSQSFQRFMDTQSLPPLIQYSGLIGKEVSYPVSDQETGFLDHMEKDIVQSVSRKDRETYLELKSGQKVSVGEITQVSDRSDYPDF
ncbi:flagellar hook assembly protein FlgD [Halobacillus karajensis]|uniref:Flagellar basal body rod modification protein n=1 Tax=Halobacillus karajensis TaxID=195088 RepID=A0A024P2B0_9BACI|nr:flagellar hook assembly protein FlgD [Halobacillus karajensis]CDQ19738.1 flagellar basal body rod modification protein [Halobacillus karajensis]CDQ22198.1 flagellar basal body rod modification protein [Halobacillus karajensis]CDQ28039.1 flagellar basal body rod modification protein [Halobacillus karajensis]